MQRSWIGLTGVCAATLLLMGVRAASADTACIQQARTDYQACRNQCQDDYRDAKFSCRGVDPACGTACLAGRMACFDDVDAILATGQLPNGGGTLDNCTDGTDGCQSRFQAAKTACGAPCNGDPTCMECVDGAQVTNFICRDTCRDSWRLNSTVKSLKDNCRTTFRACVHACPPAAQ